MDDDICTDVDCSGCLGDNDDCGDCGDCCDSFINLGDGCCQTLGDSFLCGICDNETVPASFMSKTDNSGDSGAISVPMMSSPLDIIQSQPAGMIPMIPTIVSIPSIASIGSIASNNSGYSSKKNSSNHHSHHHSHNSGFHIHWKLCLSVKKILIWLAVIAIIAALGVTLWLTRNIPFGANCGNAHRALLGVLIVIVVSGILMPCYYKYIQRGLIDKESSWQLQMIDTRKSLFDTKLSSRHKKSVLASNRFRYALMVAMVILMVVVVLGYYYLWGKENLCMDPSLWIVKGWFIALLLVALIVLGLSITATFRAVRERRKLNTYHDDPNDLEQTDLSENRALGVEIAQTSASPHYCLQSAKSSHGAKPTHSYYNRAEENLVEQCPTRALLN